MKNLLDKHILTLFTYISFKCFFHPLLKIKFSYRSIFSLIKIVCQNGWNDLFLLILNVSDQFFISTKYRWKAAHLLNYAIWVGVRIPIGITRKSLCIFCLYQKTHKYRTQRIRKHFDQKLWGNDYQLTAQSNCWCLYCGQTL